MMVDLPLGQMTLPEKLHLMEVLWEDVSQQEDAVASPEWHREVLEECLRKADSGEESFTDLESAKAEIGRRVA